MKPMPYQPMTTAERRLHKHSNVVEIERKAMMALITSIQPPKHTDFNDSETIRERETGCKTHENTTNKHIIKKLLPQQGQS